MSSSTPWITDSKYDPIWHYSEFARWVVENRELIKEKMVEDNNIREQGNRGIGYLKPQMDEIIVLQNHVAGKKGVDYYYWINYNNSPKPSQYLIDDGEIDNFISTFGEDYTKLKRRVMIPNPMWKNGVFRTD